MNATVRRDLGIVVVLAVFCLIFFGGAWYAYCDDDKGYGSSASADGDAVSYTLTADGSHEYSACLIGNGSYTAVGTVYMFYDEDYESFFDHSDADALERIYQPDYYLDQVERTLEYSGIDDITYLDADELAAMLQSDVDNNACAGKGLVMVYGGFPDTIYDGTSGSLIIQWISGGGSLYWAGEVIGKYVLTADGATEVDGQELFLPGVTDYSSSEDELVGDTDAAFREELSLGNAYMAYAPDMTEYTGTGTWLQACYSNGNYATDTFVSLGSGQVCIFAGGCSQNQLTDMAIAIASGLSCYSTLLAHEGGTVDGSLSGTLSKDGYAENTCLYLSIGGYYGVYAERYDF